MQQPLDDETSDEPTRRPIQVQAGFLLPRWPLLSLLCCSLLAAVATVLWYRGPCISLLRLDGLCRAGTVPGLVQAILVWLAFGLVWLLAYCFGARIHRPASRRAGADQLLGMLTDVESLRPIVAVFGGLGIVSCMAMTLIGRVQPVAVAMALLPGAVAVWSFAYRPRPVRAMTAQQRLSAEQARRASPLFRLRALPLLRHVWPNRPRPGAPAGQPEERS